MPRSPESPMSRSPRADPETISLDGVRALGLPSPSDGSSKHERGRVLIVGGSRETPGAVLLAANAAMRAGAGVVQIATAASACAALGIAVPEARVVALPETGRSGAVADATGRIAELAEGADAVLVGPGTLDVEATRSLLSAAVDGLGPEGILVVDAAALDVVADDPKLIHDRADRTVLMPNPNEAARLGDVAVDDVLADPETLLRALVERFLTVVAIRGHETWISAPNAPHHCNRAGHALLAVAGSGDVLGGVLVGLAARGFPPLAATLGAVYVHAKAGERVAETGPAVGRLARELLDVLPGLVEQLTEEAPRAT